MGDYALLVEEHARLGEHVYDSSVIVVNSWFDHATSVQVFESERGGGGWAEKREIKLQ